jgi:peptidoglycan/LPS O-acetylase OafA/YrhL
MLQLGRNVRDDDEVRDTPPSVVGAVAAGTAPLPFLAVYAVMFIVHGGIHPVAPPDITSSTHGELIAGIIAAGLFVVAVVALLWMLNGRRRWPFAMVQLGILATAIDFFLDDTKGGPMISLVVGLAALAALVFAFAPESWEHVGRSRPMRRVRPAMPVGAAASPDTVPDSARFVGRREPSKDSESV